MKHHKKPLTWLVAGSAAVLIGVGGIGCTPTDTMEKGEKSAQTEKKDQAQAEYQPKPKDFQVDLKTKSKQCFGAGVGCNVEVKPNLTYTGPGDIDASKTYEITYQVSGDESGPVTDTLTLTNGDEYDVFMPLLLSTPSSGTEVSAEVTQVEEVLF